MILKELNRADLPLISEIVELEEEAFGGKGGVDLWILKALLRYGKVFVLEKEEKIISIVEYMQCFDKKEVFGDRQPLCKRTTSDVRRYAFDGY